MKKILYGVLSLSLLAGALSVGGNAVSTKANAAHHHILPRQSAVTNTLDFQAMAKAYWNNNGAMVTSNEAYNYGFYSGSLNYGSGSVFTAMAKSDVSEGNLTSTSGNAQVDWGGVRLISRNNERVMVVIEAKKAMTVQMKADSIQDWNTEYRFYQFDNMSAVKTGEGVWNEGALKVLVSGTADAANLPGAYSLESGNVYVMEWGFPWGDERNWQIDGKHVGFEVSYEETPIAPTEVGKTLDYTDMHYFVKAGNGAEYTTDIDPFRSYGFYYRTKADTSLKQIEVLDSENLGYSGNSSFALKNWKIFIDNEATFVIKMVANEKVLFETFRQEAGDDWFDAIRLNIHTDDKVIKDSVLSGSKTEIHQFTARSVVNEGEVVYWEISANQINADSQRNIAMKDGGDVHTSLPQFKMTPYAESTHEHAMVSTPSTDSTCEAKGHKAYYTCSVCDEHFADHDGEEPIADLNAWLEGEGAKELANHSITKVNGQAATCEVAGWNDYYKCSECNKYFSDEAGTNPIVDLDAWKANEGKIAPLGHTIVKVDGQAATCAAAGWNDYYKCSACEKLFSDAEGNNPIVDLDAWKANEGKIEKVAHTYGEWVVTQEPTETANGSRSKTCSECGDVVTDVIPLLSQENGYTYEVVEEATTEKEGRAKWTSEEYGVFYTAIPMVEKEPEPEPAKKGCKGSVVASSIVLSGLALAGVVLVASKKKEN